MNKSSKRPKLPKAEPPTHCLIPVSAMVEAPTAETISEYLLFTGWTVVKTCRSEENVIEYVHGDSWPRVSLRAGCEGDAVASAERLCAIAKIENRTTTEVHTDIMAMDRMIKTKKAICEPAIAKGLSTFFRKMKWDEERERERERERESNADPDALVARDSLIEFICKAIKRP